MHYMKNGHTEMGSLKLKPSKLCTAVLIHSGRNDHFHADKSYDKQNALIVLIIVKQAYCSFSFSLHLLPSNYENNWCL